MRQKASGLVLDRVDRSIIRLLQDRGRESLAEIANAVGLSSPRIGERVRRLETAGVIEGYHAAVSASKLGYNLTAFILARPVGLDARFAKLAAERSEILECHRVTGDVSFVARAAVRDVNQLESLLNYLEPSTSRVVTLLVLSTAFNRHLNVDMSYP